MKVRNRSVSLDRNLVSRTPVFDWGYRKEFGHYGQTFQEIHFGHDGEGVTYFLKKEEVPEAILKLVPEADHPYVSDQSYRVLFVWQRSPDVEPSVWVMSESGRPRKIR